jgi:hypothetical protein
MIVVLLAVEYSASHLFLTIVALATIAVTLLRPTKYQGINSIIATKNIGQSVHVPEDVSVFVPESPAISMILYESDDLFVQHNSSNTVASPVFSLDIEGIQSGVSLNRNVTFVFIVVPNMTDYSCSYWAEKSNQWLSDGCGKSETLSNTTHVVCECMHLTNFAVLANPHGTADSSTLDGDVAKSLEYISYIGLSISSFLMLIVAVTFLVYKVGIARM